MPAKLITITQPIDHIKLQLRAPREGPGRQQKKGEGMEDWLTVLFYVAGVVVGILLIILLTR